MNKKHADDLIWKISECECELQQMTKQKEDCDVELNALDESLKKLYEFRTELSSITTEKIKVETE